MTALPRNVIVLMGTPNQWEQGSAGEAGILPGMAVQGELTIMKHATAGGKAPRKFALERQEMGQGINVPYAVNDRVKVGSFAKGDRVYAFIPVGANIPIDGPLTSNGDGTLKTAGATDEVWGKALEAVNNTSGAIARIRVEIE
jgi:hypothetical protein